MRKFGVTTNGPEKNNACNGNIHSYTRIFKGQISGEKIMVTASEITTELYGRYSYIRA
jgi:hypothetical protein